MKKENYEIINKICNRANEMNIVLHSRFSLLMDIEKVYDTIGLKLLDLLESSDFDFTHDIVGIQVNMNRETGNLENGFLPRFAGK